ncbi:YihY/virulence factor BrkB family protein [Streptomyces sp. NPDC002055]|uniref:YihY/virulence factor BrkB family protein n=1 Tax=Streptomyces sp. NPDC002055 TaxID=3154534 RepID=UPI003321C5E0
MDIIGNRRTGDTVHSDPPAGATPSSPVGLPRSEDCLTALRRTPAAVWNEDATDWAAALTYYAVLAVFPTLLVTVSVIGATDSAATENLIRSVAGLVPAESRSVIRGTLEGMAAQSSAAWLLIVVGTIGALWSASSYLAVFRRALHAMHGVEDQRPVWRRAPRIVLTALLLLALLVSSVLVLVLTGEAARPLGAFLGLDSVAVTAAWNALQWPMLLCLVAVLVLVLFRTGPAETRGVRRRALGGALAVVLWLIASAGFTLYTSNVGTYSRLYGSLAGIVIFLVWLWVSHLALLTGAQFNAELAKLHRR